VLGAGAEAPDRAAVRQVARAGHREGDSRFRPWAQPATQGNWSGAAAAAIQERRKELVKVVTSSAEEGGIAVRHARTETIASSRSSSTPREDDKTRREGRAEAHDEHVKQIDQLVHAKEAEIMEV
jgi:hypothetical protein